MLAKSRMTWHVMHHDIDMPRAFCRNVHKHLVGKPKANSQEPNPRTGGRFNWPDVRSSESPALFWEIGSFSGNGMKCFLHNPRNLVHWSRTNGHPESVLWETCGVCD